MRSVIIRADSSSTIGTGHIMRDLVLAKREFAGDKVIFAVRDLPGNINHKIVESGYEIELLETEKIDEVIELVNKMRADVLVVDHYGIGYEEEKRLKEKTETLLFAVDDLYERHNADILLNHNIYADEKKYEGLVPDSCELRCGAKYTLLRDEFYEAKKLLKAKNDKTTILLAMGGSDSANLNIPVLEVLKVFDNIEVHVVTTTANANLGALKAYCSTKSWISLHINSNSMAALMRQSDVGIITPSVTANEAYFMELPFIAIQTADNQKYISEFLKDKKIAVLEYFTSNAFDSLVKDIL